MAEAGLQVRDVRVRLGGREILHGVDLGVARGTITGLVGESGSGKTTLARAIAGLVRCEGSIRLDGAELAGGRRDRSVRRAVQLVQQDPATTLNPSLRVGTVLDELLRVHRLGAGRQDRRRRAIELLGLVGLDDSALERRPARFSGGQRQRIAIARALAVQPRVLVLDEPTSALDVAVQRTILDLIAGLARSRGLATLFISHDLAVIHAICDQVVVLRDGQVVEEAPAARFFTQPQQPYSRELLAAVARLEIP